MKRNQTVLNKTQSKQIDQTKLNQTKLKPTKQNHTNRAKPIPTKPNQTEFNQVFKYFKGIEMSLSDAELLYGPVSVIYSTEYRVF